MTILLQGSTTFGTDTGGTSNGNANGNINLPEEIDPDLSFEASTTGMVDNSGTTTPEFVFDMIGEQIFTYLVKVEGNCIACPVDTSLFGVESLNGTTNETAVDACLFGVESLNETTN